MTIYGHKKKVCLDKTFVAHVRKTLPVDKISEISHFVLNCQKCCLIYIGLCIV